VLMLESGLSIGEALHLEWADITLAPVNGARFGILRVREGKSKNASRVIPLTDRAAATLRERMESRASQLVFPNRGGHPYMGTSINEPPAPGRFRSQGQRKAEGDVPRRFRASLSAPYNAYKAWGIGSGRFHDHADCRSQQHRGFAAVHPSNPRSQWSGLSSGCNCPAILP
jgi:integrase